MNMKLEKIIDYNMSSAEIEAYKIALIYEEEYSKYFRKLNLGGENFKRNSLNKSRDPRESYLFKYCWKLRRELKGLIPSTKFRTYIGANFYVLQQHYLHGNKKDKVHIQPNVICGDKAWVRYKVYENLIKRKSEEIANRGRIKPLSELSSRGIKELIKFKKFIFEKCEGNPTKSKIEEFINSGFFNMWVMGRYVSDIYLILSPWMKEFVDDPEKQFGFSVALTKEKITDEIVKYFQDEFDYEHI